MANHHVRAHCLYCGHTYCARCLEPEEKPSPELIITAIYVIDSRPQGAKCPECRTQTSILV